MAAFRPLSLDHYPLDQRRQAWIEHLAELTIRPADEIQTGSGVIDVFRCTSGAVLASLAGEAQALEGTVAGSGKVLVLLPRSGRAGLRSGRGMIDLAAGDLVVIDAGGSYSLSWQADWEAFGFLLPVRPLAARLGRRRIDYPRVLGSSVAGQAVCALLRSLATNLDMLQHADASAGEVAVVELLASAMLGEIKAPEGDLTGVQAAHFRRIATAIDRRLAEPDLTPSQVAQAEGMSTRYLQRLFEKREESFSEYVRAQRLQRCRTDLLDPNHDGDSIATISLRWGFRDQAHFSRAFAAGFGLTPTDLRRSRDVGATDYGLRGKPSTPVPAPSGRLKPALFAPLEARPERTGAPTGRRYVPATVDTVHWGFISRTLPPVLRIEPGEVVTIETLTQHAGDDWDRMIAGDAGAESVFEWTPRGKAIERRGAGPIDASVFGRGAGEGFGVHICTGPIHVRGAEPGDVLEVEILDVRPRPSGNPHHAGKAFASNASAWWGYHYNDPLDPADRHETITIFEIDVEAPDAARPLYSYRWTPQTDPYGVVHSTIDYPGVRVDHGTVRHRTEALSNLVVPARMHFGFMAVAPREAGFVDSIPPGPFGGNIDNWRAGKGSRIYLPVSVEGALFSVGDGHFAQSDGEINGTGLECSLTGEFRFRLHKAGQEPAFLRGLRGPLIETADSWVIQSFSYSNYLRELGSSAQSEVYRKSTVDLALRNAFRQARRFLIDAFGFSEDEALTLMSLVVDFGITQVADGNLGVHALIDKKILRDSRPAVDRGA
jgi:acetamidase/formamidase/AraC-like DNA-binding protein